MKLFQTERETKQQQLRHIRILTQNPFEKVKNIQKKMDFDSLCHFRHPAIIKETFKALKRRKKMAINGSIGKSSEQKPSKFTKPLPFFQGQQ